MFRFSISKCTYHISQEPSVLWIILGDINKSRKSPSLSFCSSLDKYSFSSGISLPFSLATLLRISLASVTRPFFRSQRTDSGMKLWSSHKQTKQDQYPHTGRRNFSTPDVLRNLRISRSVTTFLFCIFCIYLDSLEKTGLPFTIVALYNFTEHVPIGTV